MKIRLTATIVLLTISQLFAQDFVQWRGLDRDGKYQDKNLLKSWPDEGPQLLWHFDELGEGHGSAAVTKDVVYTTGTLDEITYVFAFDHEGSLKWKSEVGKEWVESWPGVRTTPLIKDDKLYLMTGYGLIVCMNASNGDLLWKVDIMNDYDGRNIVWGMCENLLIEDEKLFCTVGGEDANVIALDKDSGDLIWKSGGMGEKSAYNTPGIIEHAGLKILVTMTEFNILGLDAKTGELLWSHPQTNQYAVHANSPLFKDGKLYCVSGYGRGGVMLQLSDDGRSIKELWRNASLDSRMGGVILDNGRIYGGGDKSRKWVCLDWSTGKELYSSKEVSSGNLIMADGLLYWYGTRGEVALVEPTANSFKVISKFKVPFGSAQHWAHLVIANKRLFLRHGNSLMVYAIGK